MKNGDSIRFILWVGLVLVAVLLAATGLPNLSETWAQSPQPTLTHTPEDTPVPPTPTDTPVPPTPTDTPAPPTPTDTAVPPTNTPLPPTDTPPPIPPPPAAGDISVDPADGVAAVDDALAFTAAFTMANSSDLDSASWDWGDGTTSTCPPDSADCMIDWVYNDPGPDVGTVSGSHAYGDPGVYPVQLAVQDSFGQSDTSTYESVVVYDPAGGFVTGGGWIDSPPGAYLPDPTVTGKAIFAFVSRYRRGATVPTGNARLWLWAGDLRFHSESYDWLVVYRNGSQALFEGVGTIAGSGEYRFMLWAGDDDPDTFRIKIWEEDASGIETVIYDNGFDQAIGRGNIRIRIPR